jgi:hypothetical protein
MRLLCFGLAIGSACIFAQGTPMALPARPTGDAAVTVQPGTATTTPSRPAPVATAKEPMAVMASDIVQAVAVNLQSLPPAQYNPRVAGALATLPNDVINVPRWQVNFTFRNVSTLARTIPWQIQLGGQSVAAGEQRVAGGAAFTVSAPWTQVAGNHQFRGVVDPSNQLGEAAAFVPNNTSPAASLTAPGVRSISPAGGAPGTTVRIQGAGFLQGSAAQVQFVFPRIYGGPRSQPVTPATLTDTEMTVVVPRAERRWRPGVTLVVANQGWRQSATFDYTPTPIRHQVVMGTGNYGSLAAGNSGNATPLAVESPDHSFSFFTWWENDASSTTSTFTAVNFLKARHNSVPESATGLAGYVPDPRPAAGLDSWPLPALAGCGISAIQFSAADSKAAGARLENPPAFGAVTDKLQVRWWYGAGQLAAGYRLAVFLVLPDGLDCGPNVRALRPGGAFKPETSPYGSY